MLRENEIVMLLLGISVLILLFFNKEHTRKIREWKIILGSYCFLLGGWFFTNLEEIVFRNLFNFFEHISYLVSALLLLIWSWKITGTANKEGKI